MSAGVETAFPGGPKAHLVGVRVAFRPLRRDECRHGFCVGQHGQVVAHHGGQVKDVEGVEGVAHGLVVERGQARHAQLQAEHGLQALGGWVQAGQQGLW